MAILIGQLMSFTLVMILPIGYRVAQQEEGITCRRSSCPAK